MMYFKLVRTEIKKGPDYVIRHALHDCAALMGDEAYGTILNISSIVHEMVIEDFNVKGIFIKEQTLKYVVVIGYFAPVINSEIHATNVYPPDFD